MFSIQQKREISDAIQKILKDTNHPELPCDEIKFLLHVDGAEKWSWADIKNNGNVLNPKINTWNESQDKKAPDSRNMPKNVYEQPCHGCGSTAGICDCNSC